MDALEYSTYGRSYQLKIVLFLPSNLDAFYFFFLPTCAGYKQVKFE